MTFTVESLPSLIGGAWVQGTGDTIDVRDPSNGEIVATVAAASETQVDQAVSAAGAALEDWKTTNEFTRKKLLHRLAELVREDIDTLAELVTKEMGKPISEARGEAEKLADAFDYYAEEAVRVYGRTIPNSVDKVTSIVRYEPIGVVGAICPWNYPLELIGWKLAASMAAGCTLVIKPSEYTPSSAVRLFEIVERAGFPKGVVNLVLGAAQTGGALTSHPGIDKVAFTGSTATGLKIGHSLARPIPSSMELGGSCPLIVTASANIDDAVAGCLRRGFRNAGQICIAINRVYVERSARSEFAEKLAAAVGALSVGPGMDDPYVGPVTNKEIQDRFAEHLDDVRAQGGRVLVGGEPVEQPGFWVSPAVVDDVPFDSLLGSTETFGPVVGITPFDLWEEAVRYANGTGSGLAVYLYATDVTEIFEIGHALDFGNVAVNNPDTGITNAPYGGRKDSGHGYEHGPEGLHSYLQIKHLRIRY